MSNHELDMIFTNSKSPKIEELYGWEFKGANTNPITKILGFKQFKKGFHKGCDLDIGYNVQVKQYGHDKPYMEKPSELSPKVHGYFKYSKDSNSIVLDYSEAESLNPSYDPSKLLIDYIVQPDAENSDIFLGKAFLKIKSKKIFVSFFILERYNRINKTGILNSKDIGVDNFARHVDLLQKLIENNTFYSNSLKELVTQQHNKIDRSHWHEIFNEILSASKKPSSISKKDRLRIIGNLASQIKSINMK